MSRLARRLGTASLGAAVALSGLSMISPAAHAGTSLLAPGDLLVAEYAANQVVAVAPDGTESVFVNVDGPTDVAFAPNGDVYVVSYSDTAVYEYTRDGSLVGTVGSGLTEPLGVAIDPAGDVYIADGNSGQVVEVDANGTQSTVPLEGLSRPWGLAFDPAGDLFVADFGAGNLVELSTQGVQSYVGSGFNDPMHVTTDASGNVFVSDFGANQVDEVAADGTQTTLPFTGLQRPTGVAVDPSGTVYVNSEDSGGVETLSSDGTQSTLDANAYGYGISLDQYAVHFTSKAPTGAKPGDGYVAHAAGAPSGSPIVLTADESSAGICTVSDNGDGTADVSLDHAGDCVINAHQDATDDYPASDAQQTVTIGQFAQDISFGTPPDNPQPGDQYVVSATGGDSGNPVTLTADESSDGICTVSDNGDGSADVSLDHPGDCVIDAHQDGNQDYAAGDNSQTVTIGQIAQNIVFDSTAPDNALPGDTYTVQAHGGDSGNPVTFVADESSDGICTVSDNGDGTADVSLDHPGDCVIDAHQDGNQDYAAGDNSQTVTIGQIAQNIVFDSTAPDNALPGDTYTVQAHGGDSGNPVTFSIDASSDSDTCTLVDNGDGTATVTLAHAGYCEIEADQAGNTDYADADSSYQDVYIDRFDNAITFTSNPPTNAQPGDVYQVSVTGSGSSEPVELFSDGLEGHPCTVVDHGDGTGTVTLNHVGTCVIDARQYGDRDHGYAFDQQSVGIGQSAQVITFTSAAPSHGLVGQSYPISATGGKSGRPVTFTADASSAQVCVVKDHHDGTGTVFLTGVGRCSVVADQAGTSDYLPAGQVRQLFSVTATQTITFTSKPHHPGVGDTYQATATGGGSSSPVVFSLGARSKGDCTVTSSGAVTFLHANPCVIVADQAGDATHDAAPRAFQSVHVHKLGQHVRFTSKAPAKPRAGTTYRAKAKGGASGYAVRILVTGACSVSHHGRVTFTRGGTCTVFAVQAGNGDYRAGRAQQVITVRPAAGRPTPSGVL